MKKKLEAFQDLVWEFYRMHKRVMPWRTDTSEYSVFVSEVMLQQTQVARVIQKYPRFVELFPDFPTLAGAPVQKLLSVWQGMGYNRRALYLKKSASIIHTQYNGRLPRTVIELDRLPGIGSATAASILAFAHNIPTVFIETNIRRVYLHHFFPNVDGVDDEQLTPLVAKTVSQNNVREWYWALMDYGAHLVKMKVVNPNRKSSGYVKQSVFKGSQREMRGQLIKILLQKRRTYRELSLLFKDDDRFDTSLTQLVEEGFIKRAGTYYKITDTHEP